MMNENQNTSGTGPFNDPFKDPIEELFDSQQVEEGKTIALISYLTIIGLVIALVMNSEKNNRFAKFHIRQSLGLMLTGLAVSMISWIPFIGWIISIVAMIALLIMWVTGILNAVNGKAKKLPFLGHLYADWFKTF